MGDLDRVRFGGEIVDRRTSNMLREAQRIANEKDPSIGKLHLSQGCFCHGVAASAGTHSGAGAFDLSVRGYSEHQKEIIALSLRKVGFASWRRMPNQGPWPEHIHGIAIGSKQLPSVAQSQVRSYLNGRDGLVGNRVDHQDRPKTLLTWEQYKDKYLDGQNKPDSSPVADTPTAEPQPDPTDAAADPYDITAGQGVTTTARDSDNDGLTDDFEKLIGTDPLNADTNRNGLTDGQEFLATQGRGTGVVVDSDHDGVADWLETAAQGAQAARAAAMTAATGQPNGPGAYGTGAYGPGTYGPGTYGPGAYGAGTYGPGTYGAAGYGAGAAGVGTAGIGTGGIGAGGIGTGGIGTGGIGTGGIGTGGTPGTGLGTPVGTGTPGTGAGVPTGTGVPAPATGDAASALDAGDSAAG
ncbi:thrombospondin type 3 repeat-containing protein [Microlunatus ginsengisoli]|uniref:Uncharacterized protein n=1 Tax=Microlunatus ginsengisoli TaxID=363863 RepID=A0ABP6ZE56_9ACTN